MRVMVDWVVTLLAAIIGAVIGGGLTFAATYFGIQKSTDAAQRLAQQHQQWEAAEQAKARAEQRRNVRTLLRLENAGNLAALDEFWHRVTTLPVDGALSYNDVDEPFVRRNRLATELLAPWGHLMWQSQAANLGTALEEVEIQDCYALHTKLEQFDVLRAELRATFNSPVVSGLAVMYGRWRETTSAAIRQGRYALGQDSLPSFDRDSDLAMYNQITLGLWTACERIYQDLHQSGNPLRDDESTRTVQQPKNQVSASRSRQGKRRAPPAKR